MTKIRSKIAIRADGVHLKKDGNTIDFSDNLQTTIDHYNGSFLETFDAQVTSDGATATMSLEKVGEGNLTMRFSDGFTVLDCTPACTIDLTVGSDSSPTENFIYIPQSTKVLTKSTSNWPATEHIKVAYFLVPSASYIQNDGVYINQNWNDHRQSTDNQGHMTHIAERIRRSGAIYFSGVAPNGTDQAATASYFHYVAANEAYFKSTAGIIYQLHRHVFAAKDTSTGDDIHVLNQSGDAYAGINKFNEITTDAVGTTLANRYFNIVIAGVGNKTGEYNPILINLPTGSYNNQISAEQDSAGYDVFALPRQFTLESATGFLIARLTLKYSNSLATLEHVSTIDLRGQTPVTATGGAVGVITSFPDNQFEVFDEGDDTKVMVFDVGAKVSTGTTRTMTVPDENGTLVTRATVTTKGDIYVATGADAITRQGVGIDGQVLAANSAAGTGLSFTTVSGGGGSVSPLTNKGDLYGYSTEDARVEVGSDGQILTADSAEATGVNYTTVSGFGQQNSDIKKAIQLSGDINPSTITGNVNDYNPTGLSTASRIRVANTGANNITGLAGGADGRVIVFHNLGPSTLTFKDQDANSSAANRFALGAGLDKDLESAETITLIYDSGGSRWREWATRGASTNESYVVIGASTGLTSERVLTAGSGITITDGGAGSTATIAATGGGGLWSSWAHIREEQSSGTDGGTFTQDAWQTRVLNTEVHDADSIVSVAANAFTLQAGTYRVKASAPANRVDEHQARLYNSTDTAAVTDGEGTSMDSGSAGGSVNRSEIDVRFTIASAKAFIVQHYCLTTNNNNGYGNALGQGTEVYTTVTIWKES